MKLLVLSLAVALLANAAPAKVSERAACTTKSQRKAWFVKTNLGIYWQAVKHHLTIGTP
jgi:hypothetical protein